MTVQVSVPIGHAMGDVQTATDILHKLNAQYPGWNWKVGIDDEPTGGVLVVLNEVFEWFNPLPNAWGLRIPLSVAYADPDRTRILRRAGQMLEFCGLPRQYKGEILDLTEFTRNYETYSKAMNYGFGPKD